MFNDLYTRKRYSSSPVKDRLIIDSLNYVDLIEPWLRDFARSTYDPTLFLRSGHRHPWRTVKGPYTHIGMFIIVNDLDSWLSVSRSSRPTQQPEGTLLLLKIDKPHALRCRVRKPPSDITWIALSNHYNSRNEKDPITIERVKLDIFNQIGQLKEHYGQ